MLRRLYVHNYRCLENFELKPGNGSVLLLLGKNGVGKSTVAGVMSLLQGIVRGKNRVSDLLQIDDFTYGRNEIPMRFELEVVIGSINYEYTIVLELPPGFKELRVAGEKLECEGKVVFSRETAQVSLSDGRFVNFSVDWHLFALPIIQGKSADDPITVFKTWLAQMMILAPIPSLIDGQADDETLLPNPDCSNFGEWVGGVLSRFPAAYTTVDRFLRTAMPDLKDFTFESIGGKTRQLKIRFIKKGQGNSFSLPFSRLSDGEKCLFIGALVMAANEFYGPLLCFWDEPDSYLSLAEVGHFISALRRSFVENGQLLASSHNSEAISRFSDENTVVFQRGSHSEPVVVRPLSEINYSGLIDSIIGGEI